MRARECGFFGVSRCIIMLRGQDTASWDACTDVGRDSSIGLEAGESRFGICTGLAFGFH